MPPSTRKTGDDGSSTESGGKAVRPFRRPHADKLVLALIVVWILGMILAIFVPALIVPPSGGEATVGEVLLALGFTLAGAAVMIGVGFVFMRRYRDPVATAFGFLSGVTVTLGGLIMAATKLTGA